MSQYDFYDWQRHPSGLLIARDFWGKPTATNVCSDPGPVLTWEALARLFHQWRRMMPPSLPDLTREAETEEPFLQLPVEKLPEEVW